MQTRKAQALRSIHYVLLASLPKRKMDKMKTCYHLQRISGFVFLALKIHVDCNLSELTCLQ